MMRPVRSWIFFASFVVLVFCGSANAQDSENGDSKKSGDRPVVVTSKPKPRWANCQDDHIKVMILVTFDKSGEITKVEVRKRSGCDEFDKNAVAAAQNIKFEPAQRDGEPITVVKSVEYMFNRY
jgi:TonB family protein